MSRVGASGGYADIDCVELMIRNIEAREGMTRPSMRMIGHTTYLVFARKVQKLQQQSEDDAHSKAGSAAAGEEMREEVGEEEEAYEDTAENNDGEAARYQQ